MQEITKICFSNTKHHSKVSNSKQCKTNKQTKELEKPNQYIEFFATTLCCFTFITHIQYNFLVLGSTDLDVQSFSIFSS